ncbi:MAG: pilus assembly protein [Actinobacteria bacterium]|nr:pilus assembly protein [Actinomycetota bacterium]MBV8960179.1 pilus assembly protein [Actinomycetota bacterium]MBV9253673.1 pilus assembly protein [Actinomycetota bacterium]MBV9665613.1 pilus assembly protein [Actinomycetota bacterium]MBV9933375.1 pilus assembly protein [Actinomycetota bacterium]
MRRDERGATVAEAAFVVPLLFLFVLAFLDIALWINASNEASAVARDGARAGILSYRQADVAGSSDYQAIVAAINRRLGGSHPYSLSVICINPATPSQIACSSNPASGTNRIQVSISWTRPTLSPLTSYFGNTHTVSARSVMQVIS